MQFGHGGNIRELAASAGCRAEDLLDFSANINPLGVPDYLRSVFSRCFSHVVHYPDPNCTELCLAIARRFSVSPDQVLVGNGSTELLFAIPRAFDLTRALIPVPSYIDYKTAASRAGLDIELIKLDASNGFALDWCRIEERMRGNDLVVVGRPNNPVGATFSPGDLFDIAGRHPDTLFVVDEAFADFIDGYRSMAPDTVENIVVLRSMTKLYAVPGIRLGYAVGPVDAINRIRCLLPPWSVGVPAQAVGSAIITDLDFAERSRQEVRRLRHGLQQGLARLPGLRLFPSEANFLLLRLSRADLDAPELARRLLARGIAIRVCDNFEGLDKTYFRVAVRPEHENEALLEALADELKVPQKALPKRPVRTPALMFQGVSSNAGKSVLTAALCRILLQDGYSPAPFKAQNMSLNSFVTREGGEMGRAQVVQAQACRLEPDVRMNPILLKPNSDTGSQVIVMGRPVDNMDVTNYIRYKSRAFETVKKAYDSLASEFDAVILEGAGSPAEVNLRNHDIVNMTMAGYAGAPVIIVGDIDRGGVFASFVGTLELLTERDRALTAGFLINRFRGKEELLRDAVEFTERRTGLPIFGVIPYINGLGLPEEDSVAFKAGQCDSGPKEQAAVDIAILDLPHISNFTDFDSLGMEPDVRVRIVRSPADLGSPDALVLPGSKNVIGDLEYLRRSGLVEAIAGLARESGTEVAGICGGFQMLGRKISDPFGIESREEGKEGISLLPITTTIMREKTLKAVSARHAGSGLALKGYEIHHGRTPSPELSPVVIRDDGEIIGVGSKDGKVWGTYLHGIFDADEFRRWFIDRLRVRKGLSPVGRILAAYDLDPALDRLADIVRERLPMETLYRLMGL